MRANELPKDLYERIKRAVDSYDPIDIEWFARQAHGKTHYKPYDDLGFKPYERFKKDAIAHLTGLISQGFVDHIPTSSKEFRDMMSKEAIPRIKETHSRTVEWVLDNMPDDIREELADMGVDFAETEWVGTYGSDVECNYYRDFDEENKELCASTIWNVSADTWSLTKYSEEV